MKFTEDLKTFTIQRILIIIMPTGTRFGSGIIYTFKASRCLADESVQMIWGQRSVKLRSNRIISVLII